MVNDTDAHAQKCDVCTHDYLDKMTALMVGDLLQHFLTDICAKILFASISSTTQFLN